MKIEGTISKIVGLLACHCQQKPYVWQGVLLPQLAELALSDGSCAHYKRI